MSNYTILFEKENSIFRGVVFGRFEEEQSIMTVEDIVQGSSWKEVIDYVTIFEGLKIIIPGTEELFEGKVSVKSAERFHRINGD